MKNEDGSILLTIANVITMGRLFAVPFVIFLLANSSQNLTYEKIAFLILVLLQVSDILDGFIARQAKKRTNTSNRFGQIMDPVADKFYINSTCLTLSIAQAFPWWITFTILGRDMVIFIGWLIKIQLSGDASVKPNFWGKAADSCQAFQIFAFLLHIPYRFFIIGGFLTVTFTVISGLTYMIQEVHLLRSSN